MPAAIRPAHASDVDDLAAIENAVFEGDRISRKSFNRLIGSDTATVLVSEDDDSIRGYCVVLFRADSMKARLYSIAVAPGLSGVGLPLLKAAENAAASRCRDRLRLEVRRDNPRAVGLYEKSGYRRTGTVEDYYADGMTALRYEKSLPLPACRKLDGPASSGTVTA